MATKPRVKIPDSVTAGEVITVKALLRHAMETGERRNGEGNPIARDIINRFEARFDGAIVFAVDLNPGIAANPFLEFTARIDRAGTFRLTWTDDGGEVTEFRHAISVSP